MMKRVFLLVLAVMAGCKADDDGDDDDDDNKVEINACRDGWVEFICHNPDGLTNNQQIYVVHHGQTTQISLKDEWENKDGLFLFYNTTAKNLTVVIKQLQPKDFGNYKCTFNSDHKRTFELEEVDNCQTPVNTTMDKTQKTTFTCGNSGFKKSRRRFFCKEKGSICEDIFSTTSSSQTNGSFTLTNTDRDFSISISDVSSDDAGVYWCGEKSNGRNYRSAFRKLQLNVPNLAGGSDGNIAAGIVCAVIVVVVILVVLFHIRSKRVRVKRSKDDNLKSKEKDHSYAEIQEPTKKPDSGTAMKTVYATANFPTNPSAFMNYSTITFGNISDEGNVNIYSTVKDNEQQSAYATVFDANPSV